jgi:hypothetical protein
MKLAYRIAGVFCCLMALFLLGSAIYFPFFTIMAPPGKAFFGVGGLFGAIVIAYVESSSW